MEVELKTRLTAVAITLLLICVTLTWIGVLYSQSLTVEVDKKVYGFSETVKVRGTATPFALIAIQIYDPGNRLVAMDQVRATDKGTYEASFRLPSKIPYGMFEKTGTYKVRVTSQGVTVETIFEFSITIPAPQPVSVSVLTPEKVEVAVNVTKVLEAKMNVVEVAVPLATTPQLSEVKVVVDNTLPEKVPVKFNLTQALEAGKVVKELTLSIHDKSVDVKVSLHLPKNTGIVAPEPVKCLNVKQSVAPPETPKGWVKVVPPIDIGPSGVKFDKPIVINFTYTDETVKKLGVDEKRLTIAYYDEKAAKWISLRSVVNTEKNYVYAEVDHLTAFTVVQKPLPAEFKVSGLTINPAEALIGQAVEVGVEVTNVGEEAGEYTLTLKVNGRVETSKTVSLMGGAREAVKFSLVKDQPGTYSVEVDGLTGSFNVKLVPAEFKLVRISVNPLKVKVGEAVNVTVEVLNVGGQEGVKTVSLKVNEVIEATKDVTVKAGETKPVTFMVVKKEPGTYKVEADGLTSTFTVEAPPPSRCLIATATYGSELTPEVQLLRGFRDDVVLSTFAGSMFMESFNAWYYSWSPMVAEAIAKSQIIKEAVKIILYPLMGILKGSVTFIYPALSFNPELGIIVTGIVISSLIGVTYLTPPLTILLIVLKRRSRKPVKTVGVKALTATWLSSLTLTALSVASSSSVTTMVATAILVLTTLSLSAWIVAVKLVQRLP
ncbi:MAG: CFI-box-CTERM domain-containing protein [Candidatus Nezhaarchaeales archaeon]